MKKSIVILLFLNLTLPLHGGLFERIYGVSFKVALDDLLISLNLKKPGSDCKTRLGSLEKKEVKEIESKYKEMKNKALEAMDYKGEEVQIYKVDGEFGRTNGRWIIIDPEVDSWFESEFTIYHEAAHVVLRHGVFQYCLNKTAYPIALIVLGLPHLLCYKVVSRWIPQKLALMFGLGLIINSFTSAGSVSLQYKQRLYRDHESNADELAIRSLYKNNRKDVIKNQIEALEKRARESVESFVKKYEFSALDKKIVNDSGLVFEVNAATKQVGNVIDYVDCFSCRDNKKMCSECRISTHPSLGRRYFLWKETLEKCENQSY